MTFKLKWGCGNILKKETFYYFLEDQQLCK